MIYGFGPFTLDVPEQGLTRGDRRLPVSGKTFDVLRLLVEARGRLVRRETFVEQLWPNVTVEARNLTVRISTLRKVLADDEGTDYIETVARIGYRISVPVELLTPDAEGGARPLSKTAPAASAEIDRWRSEARSLLDQEERIPALRALGLFERVLALDPGDATSHAGLVSTYLMLSSSTIRRPLPADEAARLAHASARRALVLDEDQGEAWAVLGWLKMAHDRDWRGAAADLEQATSRDPNSIEAAVLFGKFLSAVGRHEESIGSLTRARQLNPLRRATLEYLGRPFGVRRERALAILADAAAIDPSARRPHFRRMVVLDHLGRYDEAMAERATWLQLFDEPAVGERLARLARTKGYRAAMTEWIAMLVRLDQWYEVAIERMVIDDRAGALEALERCVAQRIDGVISVARYPCFRPLHDERRFRQVLQDIGLITLDPRTPAHEKKVSVLPCWRIGARAKRPLVISG